MSCVIHKFCRPESAKATSTICSFRDDLIKSIIRCKPGIVFFISFCVQCYVFSFLLFSLFVWQFFSCDVWLVKWILLRTIELVTLCSNRVGCIALNYALLPFGTRYEANIFISTMRDIAIFIQSFMMNILLALKKLLKNVSFLLLNACSSWILFCWTIIVWKYPSLFGWGVSVAIHHFRIDLHTILVIVITFGILAFQLSNVKLQNRHGNFNPILYMSYGR